MPQHNIVFESQIDWLTCAVHTEKGATELEHYARMLARTSEGVDQRELSFRLKGYQGWMKGRVRFGSRPGAAIIQLSGDVAALHFDQLTSFADSVSRIDIAVTVRLDPPNTDQGVTSYTQAVRWYKGHGHAARPQWHADADGGCTCYVGDRSSDWFLRIYNKASESADDPEQAERYRDCWRYELEVKGHAAQNLAASLAADHSTTRAADVQSMLWEYVTRHGITAPFPHAGGAALVPGFRRRSDRRAKLDWLQRCVRPTLQWLADTGDVADMYEALGLTDPTAEGALRYLADTREPPDDPT